MDIYFLRHASAGSGKLPGKEDDKRPIDEKGERQSRDVGRLLARLELAPDAFISSPLTRAIQTAKLAAKEMQYENDLILDDALRPDASYASFQELLKRHAQERAIIVTGHNPTLSEFLSLLVTHGASSDAFDLKKAAVAKVEYGGTAVLQWCITPELMRAAASE